MRHVFKACTAVTTNLSKRRLNISELAYSTGAFVVAFSY
jgi:hypothetical protein